MRAAFRASGIVVLTPCRPPTYMALTGQGFLTRDHGVEGNSEIRDAGRGLTANARIVPQGLRDVVDIRLETGRETWKAHAR